jgi:hypothetical protein
LPPFLFTLLIFAFCRSALSGDFRSVELSLLMFRVGLRLTHRKRLGSKNRRFRMTADAAPGPAQTNRALGAIAAGGLIAGSLDLTQAIILFGRKVPLVIAAGLLGPAAFNGGTGTYVLGVLLHFFIACSAAAIYYGRAAVWVFCWIILWCAACFSEWRWKKS